MLETGPSFRPVWGCEGYPPLEDLGLIGDGATAALVGNCPQAFSHIGVIASGVTLARATGATGGQASTAGGLA